MTKTVDVDLRIRAKNLVGKTLREINADVDKLQSLQIKQAKTADLAAASTKELVAQQNFLGAAMRELARRRDLVKNFQDQRTQIGATATKLKELTAQYRAMQRGSGGNLIGFSEKDMRAVGKQVVETERSLTKLVEKNRKAGESLKALGIDADKAKTEFAQLDAAVLKSGTAYDRAVAAVNEHSGAVERNNAVQVEAARRTAQAASQETQRQERINASIRESIAQHERLTAMRKAATAAFGPEFAAQQRQNEVRDRLIRLLNTERGQRILNAEAQRRQTTATNQNTAAHIKNDRAVRQGATGLNLFHDTGRKSLSTYQRIRGQVLGLAAAYIGVYQAISTFQKAIAATTRNQALLVGLKTINNGDARAAADDYQFLRQEADRLGLVFDDIAPKFVGMSVAGRAVGLTGSLVRKTFSDIATSVAAGNLAVDEAEGVFKAIVQIMSKGKVQAEELRGQLGDRLPGAVVKFAQANNIALQDLDKQLKDGTVGLDKLIKFVQEYSKQFESTMGDVTDRLQAHINRAKNAYNDFLRSLLSGANEQKLKDAFERISSFFQSKDGQKFATEIANLIGHAIDVFIKLAENIDKVKLAVKALIAVQVLKFLTDTALFATRAATGIWKFGKFVITLTGALRAGTPVIAAFNLALGTGTTAAAGKAGAALTALRLGPVAALLAIAAAGIIIPVTILFNQEKNAQKRKGTVKDLIGNLNRGFAASEKNLSTAEGKSATQLRAEIDAAKKLIEVSDKRTETIQKEIAAIEAKTKADRRAAASVGTNDHAVLRNQQAAVEGVSEEADALRANLALMRQRTEEQRTLVSLREKDLKTLQEEEAKADAAALARLAAQAGEGKDKDKKNKGKTAKQEQAEENARLNAARAIQKELLDLDTQILDARINGEFTTAQQIEENYRLRLQQIANEIAEKQLDIDRLAQNAKTAGNLTEQQGEIDNARKRVSDLEAVLRARAEEDRLVAQTQLKEKALNDLIARRDAEIETINTMVELGLYTEAEGRTQVIALQEQYRQKILQTVEALRASLMALPPDLFARLGADKLIQQLDQIVLKTNNVKTNFDLIVENLGGQFAQGVASAFGALGKGLAGAIKGTNSLGDAFKAAGESFLNFAADFLVQIGEMIMQAIILQAIKNAINGTSGGYAGAVVSAFTQHTGGVVGSSGLARRDVSPMVFAGARRFHEGGLPGLRSNEVATILEKGEEVVTENNPRHIANAGSGMGSQEVNIANFVDSASVFEAGGNSPAGKKTIYNIIRADRAGFRKLLGV